MPFNRHDAFFAQPLQVFSSSPEDGVVLPMNHAVAAVVAGCQSTPRPFYGPVLVLKCADRSLRSYVDIGDDDLLDVRAYLASLC